MIDEAIELFLENDKLQDKVVKPLKKKLLPYIVGVVFFNLAMFLTIIYIAIFLTRNNLS
jgi:hypothetical protein